MIKSILLLGLLLLSLAILGASESGLSIANQSHNLFLEGEVIEAKEMLESALLTNDDDDYLNFEYSRILFYTQEFGEAYKHYNKIKTLGSAELSYYGGIVSMYKGVINFKAIYKIPSVPHYFKKGAKHLDRAIELNSNEVRYIDAICGVYVRSPWILGGNKSKAKAICDSQKGKNSLNYHYYSEICKVESSSYSTYQTIIAECDSLTEPSKRSYYLYELARDFDLAIAEKELLKSYKYGNKEYYHLLNLARSYAYKERSKADLQRVIEYFLELNENRLLEAFAYGVLAKQNRGNVDVSTHYLNKAKEIEPLFWRSVTPPPSVLYSPVELFFEER